MKSPLGPPGKIFLATPGKNPSDPHADSLYCENHCNRPDYGCQQIAFFVTVVVTRGIFFVA